MARCCGSTLTLALHSDSLAHPFSCLSLPDTSSARQPETITYREATLTDVHRMSLLRDASGWLGGATEERMSLYLTGVHHPQHALPPRVAIVAESGGALLGFVAGHLTTRFGCSGELQWVLVDPGHRGGPVASGLMTRIAEWFVANNSPRVCVNVEPGNVRARRFYQRHGAVDLDPYWMVWTDISVNCTATGVAGPP